MTGGNAGFALVDFVAAVDRGAGQWWLDGGEALG